LEGIIRESVYRHGRAGGRQFSGAQQWVQRGGYIQPTTHPHHDSGLDLDRRAKILIRAMIMASQADGAIDRQEQANIVSQLQPLDRTEEAFLQREFKKHRDVHTFAKSIPRGMEYEVYNVSLLAMNLDTHREADYLRELAGILHIAPDDCNEIHRRVNAPFLY